MYIENIIAAKNQLGISSAEMARRSKLGLSERTIRRFLNNETKCHNIETVLDIAATVGLSEQEIVAGTGAMITNVNVPALQVEIESLRAERDNAIAEIAVLRAANDELKTKVDNLKDELLETHKYYIRKEQGNTH